MTLIETNQHPDKGHEAPEAVLLQKIASGLIELAGLSEDGGVASRKLGTGEITFTHAAIDSAEIGRTMREGEVIGVSIQTDTVIDGRVRKTTYSSTADGDVTRTYFKRGSEVRQPVSLDELEALDLQLKPDTEQAIGTFLASFAPKVDFIIDNRETLPLRLASDGSDSEDGKSIDVRGYSPSGCYLEVRRTLACDDEALDPNKEWVSRHILIDIGDGTRAQANWTEGRPRMNLLIFRPPIGPAVTNNETALENAQAAFKLVLEDLEQPTRHPAP